MKTQEQVINEINASLHAIAPEVAQRNKDNIIFPKFLKVVTNSPYKGLTQASTFLSSNVGDPLAGLITAGQTNLTLNGIEVNSATMFLTPWAKKYVYTIHELEKFARLGIQLAKDKMEAITEEADNMLQHSAFVGVPNLVQGLTGLLNNPDVGVLSSTPAKSKAINAMSFKELNAFYSSLFKEAISNTNGTINTLAVSYSDYIALATTHNEQNSTTSLELLTDTLSSVSGTKVQILQVPRAFSEGITEGKTRLAAYDKNAGVEMHIPTPPVLGPVKSLDDYLYGGVLRMEFSSVLFKKPTTAIYMDY